VLPEVVLEHPYPARGVLKKNQIMSSENPYLVNTTTGGCIYHDTTAWYNPFRGQSSDQGTAPQYAANLFNQ
jgi:hypothetical protein